VSAYVNSQVQEALRHVAKVLENDPSCDPVAFLRECADELDEDDQ
jgi:hypothetical protein